MTSGAAFRTAVVLCLLAMGGCVTTVDYGPIGPDAIYGFSDRANPDGGYTVRVDHLDPDNAFVFWDRRASELCDGKVARKLMHTAIRPTVRYERYGGMPGHFIVEGYVYCETTAIATRVTDSPF